VSKITKFADFKRVVVNEIILNYRNRRDNLYMRKRYPFEFKTIDYY